MNARKIILFTVLAALLLFLGIIGGWEAVGTILTLAGAGGVWWYLTHNTNPANRGESHQRGGVLVDTATLQKLARAEDPAAEIFVGEVGIPWHLENRHFLLAGSTGSGKSQAFYQIAKAARDRGDAAIVADLNAEMLSRFYDPARGDVILSPLDERSASWSPLAEIGGDWDAERIAHSIIPPGEGSSVEWNHYGQVLLTSILAKIWSANGKNFDLTQMVLSASNEELAEALAGTQATQFFAPGAERMLSSIRAIVASHCQPFSYLKPDAGKDAFSITKFVHAEARKKGGAFLFFPVRADFFKSFRPLIAGQIDISISALLSADDDENRRCWYMLDEFASWGQLASVGDLLTKARKKGGVGVLGLQAISQLREAYGINGSQTLLANLGNWLTLRAGDSETADLMSRGIGDEQVRRLNQSFNPDDEQSMSEQIAVQRVIMPADLQNLPDLVGILNIAGPLPAGWVQIPISNLPRHTPGFKLIGQGQEVES